MSETCALIDAWLYHSADVDDGLPPDDLVAHVSDCPRCRVALIALLADRLGLEDTPLDQHCAAVEAAIPAFVDYERSHGLVAAARAFPDVWWHTLICPDCDELYRALHTLAAPPLASRSVAPPVALPVRLADQLFGWPSLEVQFQIHPGAVSQLLSASRHLGAGWGEHQDDDMVIAEQRGEIGVLQVTLRRQPPDRLALVIRTDPPIAGVVLLAIAGRNYYEPLDMHGSAVFSGLDEDQFSGGSQPLRLTIRPAAT